MSRPRLLLLDEPSMGLAPILVQQIFQIIREINAQGITILLVEQNAQAALQIAHRGYVLETGTIVLSGKCQGLAGQPAGGRSISRNLTRRILPTLLAVEPSRRSELE